jgi:hypothetical protein
MWMRIERRTMRIIFRTDRSKLYEQLAIAEEHVVAGERNLALSGHPCRP